MSGATQLVVALRAEARPIIEHFGLKQRANVGMFLSYGDAAMTLIVGGVGSTSVQTATKLLYARKRPQQGSLWVNIGVCGHPCLSRGTVISATEVLDRATGERWKVIGERSVPPNCLPTRVITVEEPEQRYGESAAYEMEAAGFLRGLADAGNSVRRLCVKVVSDNRKEGPEQISARMVSELIRARLTVIESAIAYMCGGSRGSTHVG